MTKSNKFDQEFNFLLDIGLESISIFSSILSNLCFLRSYGDIRIDFDGCNLLPLGEGWYIVAILEPKLVEVAGEYNGLDGDFLVR